MFRWLMKKFIEWFFTPAQIEDKSSKKERIPTYIRDSVWETYHNKNTKGKCYCCNISVNRYHAGWHCSHVMADTKGGLNTIENLRVCCAGCNLSMGDQNMYAYIRDKKLKGAGSKNIEKYFKSHPKERYDKRTNNWNKKV